MTDLTFIGKTNWRDSNQLFGIKDQDRLGHIYVIGKTGTGKSTLLLSMAISDIQRGHGVCIIDPHGDIAEQLLHFIPAKRMHDVIYVNATDSNVPVSFNPLDNISPEDFHLITSNLISTFKKIWNESWGPRLEHILRYSILSLLPYTGSTLLDIPQLLTDPFFRRKILNHVSDTAIVLFWENEYEKYTPQFRSEAIAPILNKIGVLLASQPLRAILGQPKSSFAIAEVLQTQKILICNLSKGQIGEDAASLLGSILVSAIQHAAFERANMEVQKRKPFFLYIDEVHSFITLSFADILAEARKYGLSVFLAHQYLEQLHEKIQAAIFGNVGTLISFRVGAADAAILAKEFHPIFTEHDLVSLPRYGMYLKLLIDGATSKPFSAETLPPPTHHHSKKATIIVASRKKYGMKKMEHQNKTSKNGNQDKGGYTPTLFSL